MILSMSVPPSNLSFLTIKQFHIQELSSLSDRNLIFLQLPFNLRTWTRCTAQFLSRVRFENLLNTGLYVVGGCFPQSSSHLLPALPLPKRRDSYGLDGRGVGVRASVETKFFSSPRRPDRFWGPPSLLSIGYRFFMGIRWPGRETTSN
jgi:hypothetical protein